MLGASRAARLQKLLANPNDREHGTIYGYSLGCRCEECRAAQKDYDKAARRRRAEREIARRKAAREKAAAEREERTSILNPVKAEKQARAAKSRAKRAKKETVYSEFDRVNMGGHSVRHDPPRCEVCGRTVPLNDHHVVFRSHGGGNGPTITLCGIGNNAQDADGKWYCHGLAHHGRLHFRYVTVPHDAGEWNGKSRPGHSPAYGGGHWEYLLTDEPVKVETAWNMEGWRDL